LIREIRRNERSVSGEKIVKIARCFFGKGSTEDYELTLCYVLKYPPRDFQDIQSYADKHLGIDCSSFVNAYFKSLRYIERDRPIGRYARGPERHSIDNLKCRDVLVWGDQKGDIKRNPGHIALIDQGPHDIRKCTG